MQISTSEKTKIYEMTKSYEINLLAMGKDAVTALLYSRMYGLKLRRQLTEGIPLTASSISAHTSASTVALKLRRQLTEGIPLTSPIQQAMQDFPIRQRG